MELLYKKMSLTFILSWALAFLFIYVFVTLSEGVLENELGTFDMIVGALVRSLYSPGITEFFIFITRLGSGLIEALLCVIIACVFLFYLKEKWKASFLVLSLISGWLLNEGLKFIFHRQRPTLKHLVEVGGYSFPSGHAMVSTIFYGMLGYLIWTELRQRNKTSWYVIVASILLILLIGISRIYLGVHFATDVLGGFSMGGIWLLVFIWGLNRMSLAQKKTISIR